MSLGQLLNYADSDEEDLGSDGGSASEHSSANELRDVYYDGPSANKENMPLVSPLEDEAKGEKILSDTNIGKSHKRGVDELSPNYTDSEGEEDHYLDTSIMSNISSTGKPAKKRNSGLVSFSYGAEDGSDMEESDEDEYNTANEEPHEDSNSNQDSNQEPMDMDTGSDDDIQMLIPSEKNERDLGIELPPPPPGKASQKLQDNVMKLVSNVYQGHKNYNALIQNKKEFRNPSIYEKLIDLLDLDEMGTNYSPGQFDPYFWIESKESNYEALAKVQSDLMEKRAKDKTKVEVVSGAKKDGEPIKRKSRFDQQQPSR